jgi:hypothetical protein
VGVYYSHFLIPRDNTLRPAPDRIVALIEAWKAAGYVVERGSEPTFKIDAWALEPHAKPPQAEPKTGLTGWLSTAFGGHSHNARREERREPFLFPPRGESLAALSAPGANLEWRLNDYPALGARYPLDLLPDPAWRPSYSLHLGLFEDFISVESGTYLRCKELDAFCVCGHNLKYEANGMRGFGDRIRRHCPSCETPFRPQDQVVEIPIGATGNRYEERGGICYRFAIVVDCGKDIGESDGEPRDPKADAVFMETCHSALGIELYEVSHYE